MTRIPLTGILENYLNLKDVQSKEELLAIADKLEKEDFSDFSDLKDMVASYEEIEE